MIKLSLKNCFITNQHCIENFLLDICTCTLFSLRIKQCIVLEHKQRKESTMIFYILTCLVLILKVVSSDDKCCEGKCPPGNEKYYSIVQVKRIFFAYFF